MYGALHDVDFTVERFFSHLIPSFSICDESALFSSFIPPPPLYGRIKKEVSTSKTFVQGNLSLNFSIHFILCFIPPQPDPQVSVPDTGSMFLGNACFSICRHYAGMRYQMAGFHLDIIYLLYQYFILKKVHQCENWRENIFWPRGNLEIIKVKAYGSKGASFMLLE